VSTSKNILGVPVLIGRRAQLDQHYELYRKISAANGRAADLHSFAITADGTALSTIYDVHETDLSHINHRMTRGWIWDSMFQEIDLETGKAIFEWRSTEHVELHQAYTRLTTASRTAPWDFFHINCVEKDALGNYLVSSRHLRAVLYIDGRNGDVLWQLGGKKNSFTDLSNGQATFFVGQHDAHWSDGPDGEHLAVTLFDNGGDWYEHPEKESKGMRIALDLKNMTAKLEVAFKHEPSILSTSQGSYQTLPNGNVVLGYGFNGAITEYSPEGEILCDAYFEPFHRFGSGDVQSYRNLKSNWTGFPTTKPSMVIKDRKFYMSWNGATEVRTWLLMDAHHKDGKFHDTLSVAKAGFETKIVPSDGWRSRQYIKAVALDKDGQGLGASEILDIGDVANIFLDENGQEFGAVDDDDDDFDEDETDFTDFLASVEVLFGLTVLVLLSAMVMAWVAPSSQTFRMCIALHDDEKGDDNDDGFESSTNHFWKRVDSVVLAMRRKLSGSDASYVLLREGGPETSESETLYSVPPRPDQSHIDRGPYSSH